MAYCRNERQAHAFWFPEHWRQVQPSSSAKSHYKYPQGRACTSHLLHVCGYQSFLICRSLHAFQQSCAFKPADSRLAFPGLPAHLTRSLWISGSLKPQSVLGVCHSQIPVCPSLPTDPRTPQESAAGVCKVAPTRSSCPNSRQKRRASLSLQSFPSQGMGAVDLPHENALCCQPSLRAVI